jgi:chromosome segregation ATPase
MDIDQLRKTVDWLDDERRKDKAEIAALQERLASAQTEINAYAGRIQRLESELSATSAFIQKVTRFGEMLDQMRLEVTRQIAGIEQRRGETDREAERLRQIERDGLTRAIGDLRKPIEAVPKLEQEMAARKEEEKRVSKSLLELQKRVTDVSKRDDEYTRAVALLEEARRQDSKRIAELQSEAPELRKRVDDYKAKLEMLEELVRRNEVRITEVVAAEGERRTAQGSWMEQQSVTLANYDRWWAEFKDRAEAIFRSTAEYEERMRAYAETHRGMKQALDEHKHYLELMERRASEIAEIQRLAEERFRQEWNTFLSDEQKRWTTHLLLRDEQWREHDRSNEKIVDRLATLEDEQSTVDDQVRSIRELDAGRLQTLANVLREWLAEYDQTFVKVR